MEWKSHLREVCTGSARPRDLGLDSALRRDFPPVACVAPLTRSRAPQFLSTDAGQVGRLLGSFWDTEAFLKERPAHLAYDEEDFERDRRDLDRMTPR